MYGKGSCKATVHNKDLLMAASSYVVHAFISGIALLMTEARDITLKELTKCRYLERCDHPKPRPCQTTEAACTDSPYFSITLQSGGRALSKAS